jgi:hypothetical protein
MNGDQRTKGKKWLITSEFNEVHTQSPGKQQISLLLS